MNLSSVIGLLWVAFGIVLAGVCAYALLTEPFLPASGGTRSYILAGLFAIAAIAAGVSQSLGRVSGYIGTAIMATFLLPYITLYFLFLGYRSGFLAAAYCAAVAAFSLATIYGSAIRLKKGKI